MHRVIAVSVVGSVVGLTLAVELVGCTTNAPDGAILVLKNVAAGSGCVSMGGSGEIGLAHGSLDVLVPTGYLFFAQLKSRITALAGEEDQKTIITSGARVDITFPGSTLFSDAELADLRSSGLTHFRTLFTAPISPNSLTDAPFEIIPAELAARIGSQVPTGAPFHVEAVVSFTVEGDMSGQPVVSQLYSYPVTVGRSISVFDQGTCPLPMSFGIARAGYSCNVFQDGVVDCCHDPAHPDRLTCPATVSTM